MASINLGILSCICCRIAPFCFALSSVLLFSLVPLNIIICSALRQESSNIASSFVISRFTISDIFYSFWITTIRKCNIIFELMLKNINIL